MGTSNNNEITTPQQQFNTLKNMVESQRERIQELLGTPEAAARALRVYLAACTTNPKLLKCSPPSILTAMITAATFKLDVNTPEGHAYIIPYGDKAQLQLGYAGIMEMGYRSGVIADIQPRSVRENDEFSIEYGLHPNLIHRPLMRGERGKVIGYYAVVTYITGETKFEYWTVEDCEAHRDKFSKNYAYAESSGKRDSTWHTNFDAMAMKTVIIAALKYAPKSIDDNRAKMLAPMREAIAVDVVNERGIPASDMGVGKYFDTTATVVGEEEPESGSKAMDSFVKERKSGNGAKTASQEAVGGAQEAEVVSAPDQSTQSAPTEPEGAPEGNGSMDKTALIIAILAVKDELKLKGRYFGDHIAKVGGQTSELKELTMEQLEALLARLEAVQEAAQVAAAQ